MFLEGDEHQAVGTCRSLCCVSEDMPNVPGLRHVFQFGP